MQLVPDAHHISRYCKSKFIAPNGRVTGQAFVLREDEAGLSVNWLEHIDANDVLKAFSVLREVFSKKMNVSKTARFAKLCVGSSKKFVCDNTRERTNLETRHMPEDEDPSHSEIYDLNACDRVVSDLLAEAVIELVGASKT